MKAKQFLVWLKRLANNVIRSKSMDEYSDMTQKSIRSWLKVEKQNKSPLWDDPIINLVTRFDCSHIRIGNFRLLSAPTKPFIGDAYQFLSGPLDYYVVRNSHAVQQFYYKEAWPTSMGIESDAFLTSLFFYAEYLTQLKKGITPEARAILDAQYSPKVRNAPHHPLRHKKSLHSNGHCNKIGGEQDKTGRFLIR